MNIRAMLTAVSDRARVIPIVILYVTAGCNLRCITCSYRDALPNELTLDEYRDLASQLSDLGLRRVVYSGGEPLVRRDLPAICRTFQGSRARQSLLTNGLLLEKRMDEIHGLFEEIIVSLDGPDAQTHNAIRGLDCFDQIVRGIKRQLALPNRPRISARYVIQRQNFRKIGEMISFAESLGIDRVSFLAADVQSFAFHRDHAGGVAPRDQIMLNAEESGEFRELTESLLRERGDEFGKGVVSENPDKMMHLVHYFEAYHGISGFPKNSCNAPSVSMVITSTGDILPCYFMPPYGNIRSGSIREFVNSQAIRSTRRSVSQQEPAECQRCVCTLRLSPIKALTSAY